MHGGFYLLRPEWLLLLVLPQFDMLGNISSYLVRLLAFVVVYVLHGARTTAEQLPVSAGGAAVEKYAAATITVGPKYPALMKRQGSSFVGYISSGSGCK